jgi:hypothetical protein
LRRQTTITALTTARVAAVFAGEIGCKCFFCDVYSRSLRVCIV